MIIFLQQLDDYVHDIKTLYQLWCKSFIGGFSASVWNIPFCEFIYRFYTHPCTATQRLIDRLQSHRGTRWPKNTLKVDVKKEVWSSGFRYSWRKIDWRLCFTGSDQQVCTPWMNFDIHYSGSNMQNHASYGLIVVYYKHPSSKNKDGT